MDINILLIMLPFYAIKFYNFLRQTRPATALIACARHWFSHYALSYVFCFYFYLQLKLVGLALENMENA